MAVDRKPDEGEVRPEDGLDPYADWALGPGRPFYLIPGRTSEWIPALVRLNGIDARDFASGSNFIDDPEEQERWQNTVIIPSLYTESAAAALAAPYCTAIVRESFFELVRSNEKLRAVIESIELGSPFPADPPPSDVDDTSSRRSLP